MTLPIKAEVVEMATKIRKISAQNTSLDHATGVSQNAPATEIANTGK
jgi:hypothetical protein